MLVEVVVVRGKECVYKPLCCDEIRPPCRRIEWLQPLFAKQSPESSFLARIDIVLNINRQTSHSLRYVKKNLGTF